MPTIDADGAAIRYEIDGPEGAPWLVMSNSLASNLDMWEQQVGAFSRAFRMVRYDTRGHGRSEVTPGPYSIERLGRDALALMDSLGIETAHWCGLSLGGMTGMWLAANAPERIGRLALCNTAAYMPPPDMWDARIAAATKDGMAAVAQTTVERWLTEGFREAKPGVAERTLEMILATPPAGYAACCAAIRDMDQRETIRGITAPTLVVAGAHDPATPPDRSELIAAAIDGARMVTLDAAHLSNIEVAGRFNAVVGEHLQG